MLWYKAWLETRWRFLIGLALFVCLAGVVVLVRPTVVRLMPLVSVDATDEMGRRIRESAELLRDYRGYLWSRWFHEESLQLGVLFAVLLGTGGLARSSGGGTLFTLSLPVSRRRLVGARAATGLAELFGLAFLPVLVIPLLSPQVGESWGVGSALAHGACLYAGASVFFAVAVLLSTVFPDRWRPALLALGVALVVGAIDGVLGGASPFGLFPLMTGEGYFRTGQVPWLRLLAAASATTAVLYGAAANFARRDF